MLEETSAVYLDRGHEFAFFFGPLRRLLFFRRHGRFLFIFPLIFDLFRHGMRSQDLWVYAMLVLQPSCRVVNLIIP